MSYQTFDLPNGDKASVYAFNAPKLREALKACAKQNVRISSTNTDILDSIEFQISAGRAILKSYEVKQEDGTFKELSDTEKYKLVEQRPKITAWLFKKANELAANEDKEFDEDSKSL